MSKRNSEWDPEDPYIGHFDDRNVKKTGAEKPRKDKHNPTAQRQARSSIHPSEAANYPDYPNPQDYGYRNQHRPPPPPSQLSHHNPSSNPRNSAISQPSNLIPPRSATPPSANITPQGDHRNNPRHDNLSQNSPRLQDLPSHQSRRSGPTQQPTTSTQNYPSGQPSYSAETSTAPNDPSPRSRASYSDSASSFMGDLSGNSSQPYGLDRPARRTSRDTALDCYHGPLETCINCKTNRSVNERNRKAREERNSRY